jgi:hypothetical protein
MAIVNLYLALYSHIRARKALRAKKARAPTRSRQRLVWADRLRELTEAGFTSRYRMSKQTFHKLVGLLKQTEEERAPVKNRNSNPISLELKLSMTLRALAGGSVYDVADLHKVGVSTFRRAFKYTVTLINECLAIVFPINDEAKLADIATNFRALSGGIFKGVVLAVDGVLIKISKPSYNGTQYFSRKGFYGLNVQAGVDSDRRILYLTVKSSGSTHDSTAWKSTKLAAAVAAGKLPVGYYIVGDDAYKSCGEQMLCPYPGRNLSHEQDVFNFYQSRTRISVECAFGELVGRWGILWRALRHKVPMATAIIGACARLHNYCIDNRVPMRRVVRAAYAAHAGDCDASGGNPRPIFTNDGSQGRLGRQGDNPTRAELAEDLVAAQMIRPKRSTHRR